MRRTTPGGRTSGRGTGDHAPARPAAGGHPARGRGPVRFGPSAPEAGLPVLPDLARVCAAAADRTSPEPPGGGAALREAARGYWARRGAAVAAEDVVAAPGAPPLLLALLAALGGDVLMPRPCPAWWIPQVRLLGRAAYSVPTPAECGGVPDPFALLETVRRVRAEGGDPRVLLLSPADDPTGTVAAPEAVGEACEAAIAEGLHVVSDETWCDTLHAPHGTVLFSPAERWPDQVTVLYDTVGALLPAAWPAAVARFPATAAGAARRTDTLDLLTALGALVAGPVGAAAAHALGEPGPVADRVRTATALHARVAVAAHRVVLACGALSLPPEAGRHLYADLGPLRGRLAALGVTDSLELEDHLSRRLGTPVPGGHRFGEAPDTLRVRLSTGPLLGATPEQRTASLAAPDPLALPHVARALDRLGAALGGPARAAPP
ncbi:aminotransferase class I/II-fold pyridoxal phosphate-dependent enzyme [Streptomyces liangshanensis]|uniref:aminotransferase class I/II-fold pyridoxal phosphate-dependent enzyme n=1 Tax=Streptomyces liangshanensis TaxID=2717324 RepID=UPI001FBA3F53|nr:aminotransferase class I/II-fold pyridoxal phosphate-dependent enzyme [Streptomyces liangshanensis]